MYIYEPMSPLDIFRMDRPNLDRKSENFTFEYYLFYLLHHGENFITIKRFENSMPGNMHQRDGQQVQDWESLRHRDLIIGYVFGKVETKDRLCIHVSALSVSPAHRASGLGSQLMQQIERNGNAIGAQFCDLYVREQNLTAVGFYIKNGYSTYRKVIDYYVSPHENALDMRKPLAADADRSSILGGTDIHGSML